MIHVSESMISTRARLAEALTLLIESDPRVRRWRRVEFAEDGGVVVVVELHRDPSRIAGEAIARELEFMAAISVPRLPWVRVQTQ
jgi:hypothetical protein